MKVYFQLMITADPYDAAHPTVSKTNTSIAGSALD